jgi:S-DNA-T family DNA segregation ATPase FtsK/SpoIIIE
MTDTATEPDVGTLHRLDDHRPEPVFVQLTKDLADDEKGSAPVRTLGGDQRVWRRAARQLRTVATHDRTRTAARYAARHVLYTAGGARILGRRTWDARSAARYERMMRTAEAAGNHEAAMEWEQRGAAFRAARHQRRLDLLAMPARAARAAVIGTAATGGGLIGLGVILGVASKDPHQVLAPAEAAVETIQWAVLIGSVVWGMAIWLLPALIVGGLWSVGATRQAAPRWALPAAQRGDGEPITPSIVVTALRDLGISALRNAIKNMEDAGAGMLSPIVLAGCGVELDITLPSGSSTEEVMARRRKFAENMGRHEHEVHLSVAPAARTVRAWIADSGALDEPIGPSPIVTDPDTSADYRTGRAPWGVDLRGDAALISLFQRHMLITGLSNQGKTASLRALFLWLAHDIRVEFRVADLKGIGDWKPADRIATTLIQGPTDDHVIAATHMVEGLVEEMNRRLLADDKPKEWPPLVGIVDEAQVAYGSAAIGEDGRPYGGTKATSRYLRAVKAVHDQGRAVSVTIWEGTQDPTDQNLPKRSREGNHIRASLVLGTESQAKMALGETPVNAGAAPHKLRQGQDKGVVVVAGDGIKLAPGQPSITVRTHYIDDDQANDIADRIRARRAGISATASEPAETADPLTDVLTVLAGEPRVQSQEVLHRLNALNPAEYGGWGFADLKAALEPHGAEPYKSNGVSTVGLDRVTDAVTERMRDTINALRD